MFRRAALRPLLLSVLLACGCASREETVTVASFNLWGAGANAGESIDQTVAALRVLDADLIALQETRAEGANCNEADCPPSDRSLAGELADALGYFVHEQSPSHEALWANAVLSRHPIVSTLPQDLGVIVEVAGERVTVVNIHLTDYPYQPYQLTGIDYGDAVPLQDAASAIAAAERARGAALDSVLTVIDALPPSRLTVLCGDFNEPSHLDWTEAAAALGRHPLAVAFPASRKLVSAGFIDSWRAVHPDERRYPGFTWTPYADRDDPGEHHDRIDFVYVKGDGVRIRSAAVAGESELAADIVVTPWPSDHRAVVATVEY